CANDLDGIRRPVGGEQAGCQVDQADRRGVNREAREQVSSRQEMTASFTTREVAKIVELPEPRIRSCVRAGLLFPARNAGRRLHFSFQDLLLLKTAKGLLDSRVPLPRIRRMLASLRRQLPDDQQL